MNVETEQTLRDLAAVQKVSHSELSKTSMVRTTYYILNKVTQNTSTQRPDYCSVCLIKHTK